MCEFSTALLPGASVVLSPPVSVTAVPRYGGCGCTRSCGLFREPRKVVIMEPALGVDQHAAVGEVANFAMEDAHMASSHEDDRRIAPVLQYQLREIDIGCVQSIDHRRLQHRHFNGRIRGHEFGIRQKIELSGLAVDVILAGHIDLLQQVLREMEIRVPIFENAAHFPVPERNALGLGVDGSDFVVGPFPAVAENAVQPDIVRLCPVLRSVIRIRKGPASCMDLPVRIFPRRSGSRISSIWTVPSFGQRASVIPCPPTYNSIGGTLLKSLAK